MKTHLSFATTDLDKSVAFYSTLLATSPDKALPDYALFVVDDPGLELSLNLRASGGAAGDAHYGIFVETVDEVERAIARLASAGFSTCVEREEVCCYANQTKVWVTDPEGRRWEVYTVHEDTQAPEGTGSCCAA